MWNTQSIQNLRFQSDVVTTIQESHGGTFIIWMDVQDRLIETVDGINRLIDDPKEREDTLRLYGWDILV